MKKFFTVVFLVAAVLLLVRCIDGSDDNKPSSNDSSISHSTQTASPDYGFQDTPTPYVPAFYDLQQLSAYINSNKDADIFEFSFRYDGYDMPSAQTVAQMCNACYINLNQVGEVYNLTITEYPGDRIVDAWRRGDYSSLNADESQALNVALDMVQNARSRAYDQFELELILHDMLVERITYDDNTRDISDPLNPPRNLTVIGALLDGRANCQGYSDAFYTLASLAGFTVSRISVECPDDYHMANTIQLAGQWYVLDVTYNDQDDGGKTTYGLFNAGKDMITEYWWAPHMENRSIAQYSDNNFYYIHYGSMYYDMQAMADSMVWQWSQYGTKTIRTMLVNNTQPEQFKNIIQSTLMNTGRAFNYQYWYTYTSRDTYYTIVFDY